MNKNNLLNYYRNSYQVIKQEYEELKRELEQYKNIITIKNDIICNLHKRIDQFEKTLNNQEQDSIKIKFVLDDIND